METNSSALRSREAPIAVFDSGIGGLTVLRAICDLLPGERLAYLADQAHVPYGRRPPEEVALLAHGITQFFHRLGVKLVVIACNTISGSALHALRLSFPDLLFVGMEPALKPAGRDSRSRTIGILATASTFQGELYESLLQRYGQDLTILENTCEGLVPLLEQGDFDGPATYAILQSAILPMLEKGVDTLVLGCTHFPFALPAIHRIAGPNVAVIDPSPAVARRVRQLLEQEDLLGVCEEESSIQWFTTGPTEAFRVLASSYMHRDCAVTAAGWKNGILSMAC